MGPKSYPSLTKFVAFGINVQTFEVTPSYFDQILFWLALVRGCAAGRSGVGFGQLTQFLLVAGTGHH